MKAETKKKILVIDDDPDILEVLGIILIDEGYDVTLSENGDETNDMTFNRPDLILLDIRLCGQDRTGADICSCIKSKRQTSQIPIILLSAENNLKQICEQCGANSYIRKPFDIDHLSRKVNEYLLTA